MKFSSAWHICGPRTLPGELVFQMRLQPSRSKRTCLLSFLLNLPATKSSRMETGEIEMRAGGLSRWTAHPTNVEVFMGKCRFLECLENGYATRGRLRVPERRLDRQD